MTRRFVTQPAVQSRSRGPAVVEDSHFQAVPRIAHSTMSAASAAPIQMQLDPRLQAKAKAAQAQLHGMGGRATKWARFKNAVTGGQGKSTYLQVHHHLQAAQSAKNEHEYNRRIASALRYSRKWGNKHKHGGVTGRRDALQAFQNQMSSTESQKFHHAQTSGFTTSNQTGAMTALGSGANGDAYSVDYNHKPNQVFKAESDGEHESIMQPSIAQSIAPENSHYASRGVAVSHVNEMLGLDVIPKTRLAMKEGQDGAADQLGYAMDKAKGYAQVDPVETLLTDPDDIEHSEAFRGMGDLFEENFREDGKGQIFKKSQESNEGKLNRESPHEHWAHNPTTQRGMLDLQAMDHITNAGADRHGGNYFVDPRSGRVQGIDNDFSFGSKTAKAGLGVHSQGMPPMMHEQTAARIQAMTPEALTGMLTQRGLAGNEITAAAKRLEEMQDHIMQLRHQDRRAEPHEKRIVSAFDQGTLKRIVKDDKFKSYLKRDAATAI